MPRPPPTRRAAARRGDAGTADAAAPPGAGPGYRLLVVVAELVVRGLGWRLGAAGARHVPRAGSAVLAFTHTSHVDHLVTALAVWRTTRRPVRVLALAELWDRWVPRTVLRLAGAVPVDRATARGRAAAARATLEHLAAGELVLLAPEASIQRSLDVGAFRPGPARLAARAGVPLVPTASWGSHRATTPGGAPVWRGLRGLPVDVAFGPPVVARGPDDDPAAVTARLRAGARALLHDLQRGYVDGAPAGARWVPARLGGGAPPVGGG